jgi:hypothetical protein
MLWASAGATPDSLNQFGDYLATPADALKLVFPANGQLIPVNSLSGNPNNFVFQWSSPPALPGPTIVYGYELQIYLDAAGNVAVGGSSTAIATSSPAPTVSISAGTVTGFAAVPGTTYYWRVRVGANNPARSNWSEMRSFTIQPLAAAVPVLNSPTNGASITNQSPAFSWAPVTGTTEYHFQLATTPTFGTTVLEDKPASAGTLVPVTIKLEVGKQYFWRVRANAPVQGEWSAVSNFMIVAPPTSAPPPVTITSVPAPTITIPPAQPAPTYTLAPPATEQIAPTYIWAIIIIGAILVIAVIVLVVRTRRSV